MFPDPSPDPYGEFIGKAKRYLEMEKLYGDMFKRGLKATTTTYNTLINASVQAGRSRDARGYMEVMSQEGIIANTMTYNTLINAAAKEGGIEEAESWYNRMLREDVHPDSYTFSSLINACIGAKGEAKSGKNKGSKPDMDAAENWLKRMKDCGTPNNKV